MYWLRDSGPAGGFLILFTFPFILLFTLFTTTLSFVIRRKAIFNSKASFTKIFLLLILFFAVIAPVTMVLNFEFRIGLVGTVISGFFKLIPDNIYGRAAVFLFLLTSTVISIYLTYSDFKFNLESNVKYQNELKNQENPRAYVFGKLIFYLVLIIVAYYLFSFVFNYAIGLSSGRASFNPIGWILGKILLR